MVDAINGMAGGWRRSGRVGPKLKLQYDKKEGDVKSLLRRAAP